MTAIPVIAVFDIGKTNKKLLLFDAQYLVVKEKSIRFEISNNSHEIGDQNGEHVNARYRKIKYSVRLKSVSLSLKLT